MVLFYKHWCTGVTDALQNALVNYTDNGGGMVGLHHALYNDREGGLDKDIVAQQLFGTNHLKMDGHLILTTYQMTSTNYGHFVSTYGVDYSSTATQAPSQWSTNTPLAGSSLSRSYYPSFSIYDELYTNQQFIAGQTFGRGVNDITPLFSNDENPTGQVHTSYFVKRFNPSLDSSEGRIAFFQVGERRENYLVNQPFGQIVRNAVLWCANPDSVSPITSVNISNEPEDGSWRIYPNPSRELVTITGGKVENHIQFTDLSGKHHPLNVANHVRSNHSIQLRVGHLMPHVSFET